MNRRKFIGRFASVLAATPLVVKGQFAGRVYRLGFLHPGTRPTSDPALAGAFTNPLRDLGYIEGRNLVVEWKWAQGTFERLPGFARELVDSRADVIFAVGSSAIRAAKDATTTIPIVFFTNGDPVAAGFVSSLARPGGNITGVLIAPEGSLAGKRLELLRETVPGATRRQAGRPSSLAAEPAAVGDQSQDGQGARSRPAAIVARAGRRSSPMKYPGHRDSADPITSW
jgi:putative ABC transport system substrate-binding protein